MLKSELVAIRPYTLEDRNFILATFLRGLYYGDSWYSLIDKSVFMKNYHGIVTFLIDSPKVTVRIACLKEDPETILGYSITAADNSSLHWVFCKRAWRSIGIAKSLVPSEIKTVTHLTKTGISILNKKNWSFNPFAIRE